MAMSKNKAVTGIVIPRDRIKLLAPAFTKIGKAYYSLAASNPAF